MRSNAARKAVPQTAISEFENQTPAHVDTAKRGFGPAAVGRAQNGYGVTGRVLRMYTEEEVSEMLQISLSQLRKWRMKQNRGNAQGPPFKKIGRLVRYPEQALLDYINSR